jgi:hypothetical protein
MNTYRHCLLVKGPFHQVSWIPGRFAVIGKALRLGQEEGWIVAECSSFEQDGEYLAEHERDWTQLPSHGGAGLHTYR